MKGTPKTLKETIMNGLEESENDGYLHNAEEIIAKHIKDFLAQKFQIALMKRQSTFELWEEIFPNEDKEASKCVDQR